MSKQLFFFVHGGVYTDTTFETLIPGKETCCHGPFATYKEAYDVWRKYSLRNVDDCHHKLWINLR